MDSKVVIDRGRTVTLPVSLNMDITGETITSQVRTAPEQDSQLIATWTVTVVDAPTGELTLTMDNTITGGIAQSSGFMDFKRLSGGEPLSVLEKPLEVVIQGTVTA